jgi:hypothetical protein
MFVDDNVTAHTLSSTGTAAVTAVQPAAAAAGAPWQVFCYPGQQTLQNNLLNYIKQCLSLCSVT